MDSIIGRDVVARKRTDLFGRTKLVATPIKLTAANIALVMNEVMPTHYKNSEDTDYLYWYYRGNQPARGRKKSVRQDINNVVIENGAYEIVEFKKGYEFSHPVQYTNAGKKDGDNIDVLNTYARLDKKEAKDALLAEWFYICGTASRICLPNPAPVITIDDAPYYTDVLDPRYTFHVYENGIGSRKMFSGTYAIQTYLDISGITKKQKIFGVWTDDKYFTFTLQDGNSDFAKAIVTEAANKLRLIPIIEYPLNDSRLGVIEVVMSLLNGVNTIDSNLTDFIEQVVQSLLVFVNCQLPDKKDEDGNVILDENGQPVKIIPRSGGAVDIQGMPGLPADVKYLFAKLNQSETQNTKENFRNASFSISGVPSMIEASTGGTTGQAEFLRGGWPRAEARAKSTEKMFKQAEMDYLRVVLTICRNIRSSADMIGDLALGDIEIKLPRTRSDNMLVKAQALKMLLDCGVAPDVAYAVCELFYDSNATWSKSKAFQEEDAEWVDAKLRLASKVESIADIH